MTQIVTEYHCPQCCPDTGTGTGTGTFAPEDCGHCEVLPLTWTHNLGGMSGMNSNVDAPEDPGDVIIPVSSCGCDLLNTPNTGTGTDVSDLLEWVEGCLWQSFVQGECYDYPQIYVFDPIAGTGTWFDDGYTSHVFQKVSSLVYSGGTWQMGFFLYEYYQDLNPTLPRFFLIGISSAQYELLDSEWDCLGPNIMALVFSQGCDSWPPTVTVEPV